MLPVLNRNIFSPFVGLLVVLYGTTGSLSAQRFFNGRHEIGWVAGVSNYHGDLSHGLNAKGFKPAAGMYYKAQFSGFFSYRLQGTFMTIQGTDVNNRSYNARNLTFKTDIYEIANMFEFNFQSFGMNYNDAAFSPYFFSGLNGFFFDPKRLENTDINLRNLKTEGQKRGYSLFQPAVPIGFGLKAMSNPRKHRGTWVFGIEGCWRKTFTDYLDDVNDTYPDYKTMTDRQNGGAQYSHAQTLNGDAAYSTGTMRGDTHLKDWYYTINFTLSFRFPGSSCAGF